MGFHNQSANNADEIVNKLYNKISANTTTPATYYEKLEAAAATHMNQHIQQLAQVRKQNNHMQNVLQNITSQVTDLQNQLNRAPQTTQKHPGYQHQVYPAFTPTPAPYQKPPPAPYHHPPPSPYQLNNQDPYQQQHQYQSQNNHQYQPYQIPQRNERNGRQGGRKNRGGRGGQQQPRGERYCWTHGFCTYNSSEFRQPTINHQYTATTKNTMNRNPYGCYWIPKSGT